MSNLLKSKFLLGVALVAVMFVGVVAVNATPAAADCSITTTLRAGSTGVEVSCLQTIIGATADGKFGPMTKAAVMAWQSAHSLTADGVVGPMTRASLVGAPVSGNFPAGCTSASGFSTTTGLSCSVASGLPAGCSSTAGYSSTTGAKCDGSTTTSGALTGGAGSIDSTTLLSTYSAEVINESEDGNVMSFEVKADNGSDLNLSSVKLTLTHGTPGSDRLDRYAEEVSVWVGGVKVGSSNTSDFTKNTDDSYSKNIPVSGLVVKAGQKATITIGVSANSTIDSVDQDAGDDNWTVDLDSIRYNDATGAILTESYTTGDVDQTFGFSDLSNSGDLQLKLTEGSANPNAGVVEVSESTNTTDVPMLSFKLQAQGGAIDITDLAFTLTAVGVTNISEIASNFELFKGSTSVANYDASVSDVTGTAGRLEFTDITGLTLATDSTTTFTVKAKIKEILATTGAAGFDQADTLQVDFLNADLIDTDCTGSLCTVAEDENGDTVVAGDRSGSVTGNAQSFYSEGIILSLVSKSATKTVSPDPVTATDSATYVINFDVSAVGADMYVDKTSGIDADVADGFVEVVAGQGVAFSISKNGTAADAAVATFAAPSSVLSADGSTSGDNTNKFKINEGETRHFHLTVNASLDATGTNGDGFYRVNLGSVNWDNSSANADTADSFYTFDLGDYQTPDLNLSDYSL